MPAIRVEHFWKRLLIAMAATIVTAVAHAADIQESSNKLCAFRLDGGVVRGDFDKFSSLVQRNIPFDEYDQRTSSVCLKSPGGSFDEGLKLLNLYMLREYQRSLSLDRNVSRPAQLSSWQASCPTE